MDALLITDVQKDFLPGGSLEVSESDKIIPVINNLLPKFNLIIAIKDWHPANHGSFASNHKDHQPGDIIELEGLEQILWPDHCIQGSPGAELSPRLNQSVIQRVFFKGTDPKIDSYSAFFDNGHRKHTELHNYLREKGVTRLFVTGLAADFCVFFTVKDALQLGYETYLVTDATRGVNIKPEDTENALAEMRSKGAKLIMSKELPL
jgi:nicotinamidase/pyrazinamidase